ncbi:hypothetical protein [Desulfospira joergensenii]|uniref:hypothetical protein n=1 Tax=Desulfospira joergensenii TaxID=53329 RepID=UPI0003B38CF8|nr:hypothetical protein [Desulfospira joergensenii]
MDRFLNTVRRDVPGCPNPLIKEEVLTAAIEFCRRTWAYTDDINQPVFKGDETITVSLPEGTWIVGVNHYTYSNGDKVYEVDSSGNIITLEDPIPYDFDMVINVALKPLETVSSLPNFLFNDWFQTIAAGAKAKLMIMPGRAWSNPNLAVIHSDVFEDGVGDAMREQFSKTMPTEKRTARRQWL